MKDQDRKALHLLLDRAINNGDTIDIGIHPRYIGDVATLMSTPDLPTSITGEHGTRMSFPTRPYPVGDVEVLVYHDNQHVSRRPEGGQDDQQRAVASLAGRPR